jgi:6,7-dimethyl-8-ribityllumazine synthase
MNSIKPFPNTVSFPIAIVVSEFNREITERLYQGAIARLQELQFNDEHITIAWVPGAVEIPLIAKQFAHSNKFAAIVCLGAVIRGDTAHFDYVCQQVSLGCQEVALSCDIPVIFGVLTTDNEEQAYERTGGIHGHKGKEAIDTAWQMVSILAQLRD